jgi:uncharacterized membrane protein YfcA
MIVTALLGLLAILFIYFLFYYIRDIIAHRHDLGYGSWSVNLVIGFVVDFFDVFGIGSFATSTMLLNAAKQLKHDRHLPGLLNVSFTVLVMMEAYIFIKNVEVEPVTLFALIFAAIMGAAVGGRLVPKLPERKVQTYLGFALLVTAMLMIGKQTGFIDFLGSGNTAVGLEGPKLIIAVVLNFIFGALMTLGCGLYAPCMVMVFMLGMSPIVAFPVMMGSAAALMPVAAKEFIVAGDYARKISVAFTVSGIVGVLVATNLVVNMDLKILTWIIIVVVIYTGITYVRKGTKSKNNVPSAEGTVE